LNLPLEPDSDNDTVQQFNQAVKEMTSDAYFDMEGEGFKKENVSLLLEIVMSSNGSSFPTVIRWTPITLSDKKDIEALIEQYRAKAASGTADDSLFIRELRLQASCHLTNPEFPGYSPVGENPQEAFKRIRSAYWEGKFHDVQVYEQELLKCGNIVRGLAIIESANTTILVPPGSRYLVDRYLNGLMEKE
jgi:N-methylhydantoinase A/oxoprolinase/acetone carboxylase beta subunit